MIICLVNFVCSTGAVAMQLNCLFLLICLAGAQTQSPHEYLKEPPAFLQPCQLKDNAINGCLARTVESIFEHWRDGIPGLSGVGSLEPFRVRKIRISQQLPNVAVQTELRNMSTHGLSHAKVLNATVLISPQEYTFGLHVQMSRILIESHYKLKGNVLLLNLNSVGMLRAELENLEYFVAIKTRPRLLDGLTFLNASAVKTDIARIDQIRLNFTNLFGGNEPLERSANELFNDNWRVLFELLRPVLTRTYDSVLLNRFAKIFSHVPAKFLFEDFA